MALKTPGIQARSQYGFYWGQYASIALCPNSTGFTPSTDADSLEAGDVAHVLGLGLAECMDPGTSLGQDAVWRIVGATSSYEGFQSSDLANYYTVSAADDGTCPGADDFIAIVLVAPFELRSAFNDMIVKTPSPSVSRGWRLNWSSGNLEASVFDAGGTPVTAVATATYLPNVAPGHMHALAIRVYQTGTPQTACELWLGPALIASALGDPGVAPASTAGDRIRLAGGELFATEEPLNGGIYGFGYYEGTLTDDEMRALLGGCLATQRVPDDVVWTNRWLGSAVASAPATWPAEDGGVSLERAGAPTGSTAYFPPV